VTQPQGWAALKITVSRQAIRIFRPNLVKYTRRIIMGRKQEKAEQRRKYKEAFKGVKHGHGGRSIRKKDEAALGK